MKALFGFGGAGFPTVLYAGSATFYTPKGAVTDVLRSGEVIRWQGDGPMSADLVVALTWATERRRDLIELSERGSDAQVQG